MWFLAKTLLPKADFFFFLSAQKVKAAILEDMIRLGMEGGLKTFEQVHRHFLF